MCEKLSEILFSSDRIFSCFANCLSLYIREMNERGYMQLL
ncbi:hypothetical protein GYO_0759 [Bacillus spizizenii TU-B-10]|uniref:Uncharacterized protein n=1 Tax=Bacillus spizizenii (strain DSM 15029 / JCM 12233 / NBRC 101239 / NRRL B-23049 / TU-B-10) TaxID=1052585 RepID=G4NWB6_BACS4|nr:hypothetical protein GYO_0759 [Bacillus spizizenii TU-B-10]SCV39653.1 hypothetical protein BQ1740_1073 [Bacillus subtilis]